MLIAEQSIKIVEDEFLTLIDYYDEFHVNLIFDRSIYRPMCTHMGNKGQELYTKIRINI